MELKTIKDKVEDARRSGCTVALINMLKKGLITSKYDVPNSLMKSKQTDEWYEKVLNNKEAWKSIEQFLIDIKYFKKGQFDADFGSDAFLPKIWYADRALLYGWKLPKTIKI